MALPVFSVNIADNTNRTLYITSELEISSLNIDKLSTNKGMSCKTQRCYWSHQNQRKKEKEKKTLSSKYWVSPVPTFLASLKIALSGVSDIMCAKAWYSMDLRSFRNLSISKVINTASNKGLGLSKNLYSHVYHTSFSFTSKAKVESGWSRPKQILS